MSVVRVYIVLAFLGVAAAAAATAAEPLAPNSRAPKSLQNEFGLGVYDLLVKRDASAARARFHAVTVKDPSFASAWFDLGVAAEKLGDGTAAKVDFQKYLGLAPQGPQAARARAELQLLATLGPTPNQPPTYDALIERARTALSVGLYRESILESGQAQQLKPERWEAYAVASLAMARQHKLDLAVKLQDDAVARAPEAQKDDLRTALAKETAKWNP